MAVWLTPLLVNSTLKNHQIYTTHIREKWRKALIFSESQARQYPPAEVQDMWMYTLDKCKSIYFNSDSKLVRHIFCIISWKLVAWLTTDDYWGFYFFCLLSTTLLEPITLLRRTTPYLVFLIDLKWVVYVGITQDQWLFTPFLLPFLDEK